MLRFCLRQQAFYIYFFGLSDAPERRGRRQPAYMYQTCAAQNVPLSTRCQWRPPTNDCFRQLRRLNQVPASGSSASAEFVPKADDCEPTAHMPGVRRKTPSRPLADGTLVGTETSFVEQAFSFPETLRRYGHSAWRKVSNDLSARVKKAKAQTSKMPSRPASKFVNGAGIDGQHLHSPSGLPASPESERGGTT